MKAAEVGKRNSGPVYRLYFSDPSALFSALSPKRWELMKYVRNNGPISIRRLSSELERDYKNVYDDVKLLTNLDLMHKNRDDKFSVRWDELKIELQLAA